MADEKFDVYLSSTKADLEEERNAVIDIIRNEFNWTLKHSYSASDKPVLESCLADVRSARLYVCIVGMRYGESPPGSDLSYTHHEFDAAVNAGIPVFVFLKSRNAPYRSAQRDHDLESTAITDFRDRVADGRLQRPAIFETVDDLRRALSSARDDMRVRRDARVAAEDPAVTDVIRGLLATDRAFVALPAELPDRWARITDELHAQLGETHRASRSLSLLQGLWQTELALSCEGDGAPLPTAAINRLTRLIEHCNERHWPGASRTLEHTAMRQRACRAAMKLLFALAPTQAAWQPNQWLAEQGALPFMHHHMLMAVFSVVAGKNFHLDAGNEDDGGLLKSDWVLDLGGVETGIGSNRQSHLEQQIATRFAYRKSQPVRPDGRLSEFDRKGLASRVKNRSDIDQRVYVVTELLDSDTGPDPGLVQTAQALNTRPLPRKDAACDRLRVDEFDLADAVYQCLSAIRNIP